MNYQNQRHYSSMAQGFMSKVYGWMCAGLVMTAGVASFLGTQPQLMKSLTTGLFPTMITSFMMIGIIFYLGSNMGKMSYAAVAALYLVFTGLMGVSLAPIQFIYTDASLLNVFLVAAIMFSVMAVYGWVTKSDLSSMGNLLFMALIGLIVSGLINIFLQSSMLSMVTSSIGVGIFAMLTAYDIQNLKKYSQQVMATSAESGKYAVMGAISLYLNLINMFLYLLRLFGDRRD